jgi:hypothetical protein
MAPKAFDALDAFQPEPTLSRAYPLLPGVAHPLGKTQGVLPLSVLHASPPPQATDPRQPPLPAAVPDLARRGAPRARRHGEWSTRLPFLHRHIASMSPHLAIPIDFPDDS